MEEERERDLVGLLTAARARETHLLGQIRKYASHLRDSETRYNHLLSKMSARVAHQSLELRKLNLACTRKKRAIRNLKLRLAVLTPAPTRREGEIPVFICSCGEEFKRLYELEQHAAESGGLLHGNKT